MKQKTKTFSSLVHQLSRNAEQNYLHLLFVHTKVPTKQQ